MKIEIAPEKGVLKVVATGEFSLEEAQRTFLEITDAVVDHKSNRVLFDGREIQGNIPFIERVLYGRFVAEKSRELQVGEDSIFPKFAYVLKVPILDSTRLGENAAQSRGMLVKAFDSLDEALEWLGLSE